jgi:hypothetical protein
MSLALYLSRVRSSEVLDGSDNRGLKTESGYHEPRFVRRIYDASENPELMTIRAASNRYISLVSNQRARPTAVNNRSDKMKFAIGTFFLT